MGGSDTGWRLAGLALAWLGGVALHLQQRSLWPAASYLVLLLAGVAALFAAWRWRRWFMLALCGALLCGAACRSRRAAHGRHADAGARRFDIVASASSRARRSTARPACVPLRGRVGVATAQRFASPGGSRSVRGLHDVPPSAHRSANCARASAALHGAPAPAAR
jgi:hypothetical protein